ncbi:DUF4407 domain-containing protein, partial [Mycobacterium palustre]
VGRAAVAAALGVVVGELAALVVFSSAIDHRLDERALRNADSAPAVAQASESLQQSEGARAALDGAVERARARQDQALVVARCEYHPTPPCPQTRITGVPGTGPETRTADELLADAQRELDNALAARDRQAPELDARISREQQALAQARHDVVANAGRSLGARWVAMNDVTFAGPEASPGARALRLLTIAFFALLYLLPLILRLWRGETTHDRHAAARAERERAEVEAETAIAIKRAEVRREAEIMWAEHQLTQARLAIEAQAEIDRERQRRRVAEALEAPVAAPSERGFEPPGEAVGEAAQAEAVYLPIAAEAEAASRAIAPAPDDEVEPRDERAAPLIPSIPDATKAAARWIRPLVPPFVARVIDNTTQPLRTARQVFEEVEEITFAFKRTRKVRVDSESGAAAAHPQAPGDPAAPAWIASSRAETGHGSHHFPAPEFGGREPHPPARPLDASDAGRLSLGSPERDRKPELTGRDGPRQLPPAE